jgi:hypothetical protein
MSAHMVRHHTLKLDVRTNGDCLQVQRAQRTFLGTAETRRERGENREISLPNSPHELSATPLASRQSRGAPACNALWPDPRSLPGCAKQPRQEQGGGREPALRCAVCADRWLPLRRALVPLQLYSLSCPSARRPPVHPFGPILSGAANKRCSTDSLPPARTVPLQTLPLVLRILLRPVQGAAPSGETRKCEAGVRRLLRLPRHHRQRTDNRKRTPARRAISSPLDDGAAGCSTAKRGWVGLSN